MVYEDEIEQEFDDFDETVFHEIDNQTSFEHEALSSRQTQRTNRNVCSARTSYLSQRTPTSASLDSSPSTPAQSYARVAHIRPFVRSTHFGLTTQDPQDYVVPLFDATARVVTCFRIAEAIKLLKQTSSGGQRIELFTIPQRQWQNNSQRGFILADIFFPQRPPYLLGIMKPLDCSTHSEGPHFNENGKVSSAKAEHHYSRLVIQATPLDSSSMNHNRLSLSWYSNSQIRTDLGTVLTSNSDRGLTHVTILDMRDTDWDEIEYVRGIVDQPLIDTSNTGANCSEPCEKNATVLSTSISTSAVRRVHDAWNECFE